MPIVTTRIFGAVVGVNLIVGSLALFWRESASQGPMLLSNTLPGAEFGRPGKLMEISQKNLA